MNIMPFLRPVRCLFALLASCTALPLAAQDSSPMVVPPDNSFFLHEGDSPVVFLGDSITDQRMYTTLIEAYVLTRFPGWKVSFRNVGWGGDTAWLGQRGDFETALRRDVISLHPKVVTIDFGMNDARGGDATYTKYLEYSTKLVKELQDADARVALLTPSPEEKYDPHSPGGSGYNLTLRKYADGLKLVSDNEHVLYIDQLAPFVAAIEAGRKAGVLAANASSSGATGIPRLTGDAVHPNWGGHLMMATYILQGMHAPSMVSSVTVDGAARSIASSEGCLVEWQDAGPNVIQFKRSDAALPWPWPDDPAIDLALKIPGFDPANALSHYEMKVTGLKDGSYALSIDGTQVATYDAADLAKGINLSLLHQGPIYDQGQQLLKAIMVKNDAFNSRWRNVQIFTLPGWLLSLKGVEDARDAELQRQDKIIATDEDAIEPLRQPAPHVFKLVPVSN